MIKPRLKVNEWFSTTDNRFAYRSFFKCIWTFAEQIVQLKKKSIFFMFINHYYIKFIAKLKIRLNFKLLKVVLTLYAT